MMTFILIGMSIYTTRLIIMFFAQTTFQMTLLGLPEDFLDQGSFCALLACYPTIRFPTLHKLSPYRRRFLMKPAKSRLVIISPCLYDFAQLFVNWSSSEIISNVSPSPCVLCSYLFCLQWRHTDQAISLPCRVSSKSRTCSNRRSFWIHNVSELSNFFFWLLTVLTRSNADSHWRIYLQACVWRETTKPTQNYISLELPVCWCLRQRWSTPWSQLEGMYLMINFDHRLTSGCRISKKLQLLSKLQDSWRAQEDHTELSHHMTRSARSSNRVSRTRGFPGRINASI